MKRLLLLFFLAALLCSCTYAVSREGADDTLTFAMVQANPDPFQGKIMVLGGTIVAAVNRDEGAVMEITEKPLDYWGKPKRTDRTGGRFLLLVPGALDLLQYTPGRQVTVSARVEGTLAAGLAGGGGQYPVLRSREIKLWPQEQPSWNRPQWMDPLYDPNGPGRF